MEEGIRAKQGSARTPRSWRDRKKAMDARCVGRMSPQGWRSQSSFWSLQVVVREGGGRGKVEGWP